MKDIDCRNKHIVRRCVEDFPFLSNIEKPFTFYLEKIQPLVAELGTQPAKGFHGLETHTASVVFRGIDYALSMGKTGDEIMPVIFACAFHDMARTNDDFDIEHGKNAEPMACQIMKQFQDLLDKDTCIMIRSAIRNHTTARWVAPDYISACLWDADRTRFAWKYGFDEKFFNTQRGKYVAQHFQKYLDFQRKHFQHIEWSKQY